MRKKVYVNGCIVTMSDASPEASAFGVLGDRFWIVGSDEDVRRWAGSDADVVDLGGKTVIPGLLETHNHLSWFSMRLEWVDCSTPLNRTIEDVKRGIKEKINTVKPGEWVVGHSFDDTMVEDMRPLTRYDLDEASPDNPVFVSHVCGHLGYANSKALELAGYGPDTPQPQGGEIHKDENGVPTGLLKEGSAMLPVMAHYPKHTVAECKELLLRGLQFAVESGVTGVHDAALGAFGHGPEFIQSYRELANERRLGLRVYLTIMENLFDWYAKLGLGTGFGTDFVKMGCVKMVQDGSIQGWTAALSEPYHDRREDGFKCDIIIPQDELDALVLKYHEAGMQIAVHGNGDAAIESIILAVERAQKAFPRRDPRHMLIHAQTARPEHIVRMKQAGLIPSYFVNHVYYWGDRHVSIFLGPERAAGISPLASSIKEGLIFTLHSDLPITPISPLDSIHNAVNRKTREGRVLGPDERISPMDALRAYTTWAAYTSFEEDLKGSIEVGKLADFAVLSDNILTVAPETIKDVKVLETVVGGETVYAR